MSLAWESQVFHYMASVPHQVGERETQSFKASHLTVARRVRLLYVPCANSNIQTNLAYNLPYLFEDISTAPAVTSPQVLHLHETMHLLHIAVTIHSELWGSGVELVVWDFSNLLVK